MKMYLVKEISFEIIKTVAINFIYEFLFSAASSPNLF